jgi:hypothetical protein
MDDSYLDTLSLTSVFLLQRNHDETKFIWSGGGRLYNNYLELGNPVYKIDIKKAR